MRPSKCKIEWIAGDLAGMINEVWVYNPAPGKIVKTNWGQDTFKIVEVYSQKERDE